MFADYCRAGWKICAIDRGNKAPTYEGWQRRPIPESAADDIEGAGLLHALSGTCALDIDSIDLARPFLAERGVDLDALLNAPEAVRIHSGRRGRAKLLYRLKKPLRTIKPKNSGVEFRCATSTGTSVQDVLPPSVHPDTKKPYEWRYGSDPMLDADWRALPAIPSTLLNAWRQLLTEMPAEKLNGAAHPTEVQHSFASLATWLEHQDPNIDYDEWVKVGMKLHDATGGSEEGLNLWDDWSKGATRKRKNGMPVYEGRSSLRVHWVSFSSPKGKVVATVDNELPADADEFEIITKEAIASSIKADTEPKAADKRKEALAILNERLVYVLSSERYFDLKYHRIINSDNAIEHMFTALMPRKKGIRINPIKLLKDNGVRRVDKLGFHPGRGAIFNSNGYTFANNYINRLPAPLKPTAQEMEKFDWMFARIDDESFRHWLKQFYAHVVQHPGKKIRSVPLLWSEIEGNGKTMLVKKVPALLVGSEYSNDVNAAALNSDFSGHLLNAWHNHLSEFSVGNRAERNAIGGKLKAWVTDDFVQVRAMYSDAYTIPNVFFLTASSNDDAAIAVGAFDRRWGIHRMDSPALNSEETRWIFEGFLNTPRAAGVLRYIFLNYSLDGFDPSGNAPQTSAKLEMAQSSMPRDQELLLTLWEQKEEFFSKDVVLTSEVVSYIHKNAMTKPSATRVGKLLAKAPMNGVSRVFRVGNGTFRAVIMANKARWLGASGKELMDHIRGGDDEIDFLE